MSVGRGVVQWTADIFSMVPHGASVFWSGVALTLCIWQAWVIVGVVRAWQIAPRFAGLASALSLLFTVIMTVWLVFFSFMRWKLMPEEVTRVLDNPKHVILYSIDPRFDRPDFLDSSGQLVKPPESTNDFHNHKILGSVSLDDGQAAAAAAAFRHAMDWPFVMRNMCFDPRHALRIESGGHVFDFMICYECGVSVASRDGVSIVGDGVTSGSPRVLNRILTEAHITLEEKR